MTKELTIDLAARKVSERSYTPTEMDAFAVAHQEWLARLPAKREAAADAQLELDAIRKALIDTLYDLENRLRALEGKASITRDQARATLKARVKAYL